MEAVGSENADSLQDEFQQIVANGGLAFVRDFVPGVSAIGAVIFGRDRRIVGGILLSGLELDEHLEPTSRSHKQFAEQPTRSPIRFGRHRQTSPTPPWRRDGDRFRKLFRACVSTAIISWKSAFLTRYQGIPGGGMAEPAAMRIVGD